MITAANLLYGGDREKRNSFLVGAIKKLEPRFTHEFGVEKGLSIADAHEIRRRALLAAASGVQTFSIWRADEMTPEASEALLKLLEEPPTGSYFFLMSESVNLPETLLSRLRKFSFHGGEVQATNEYDDYFTKEIILQKKRLEDSIAKTNKVPRVALAKLQRAIQLSTMLRTTRITPRYIIDAYTLGE